MTTHEIIEQNMDFATRLAYRRKRALPSFIDAEALQSAAYLGLVEAASRYDPERGVLFTAFAYRRILGAIDDYLRELQWGGKLNHVDMASLDIRVDEECGTLADIIEGRSDVDHEGKEALEVVATKLGSRATEIFRYCFIDELSMREVGEKFGVSESRISQLIAEYRKKLKTKYGEEVLNLLAA